MVLVGFIIFRHNLGKIKLHQSSENYKTNLDRDNTVTCMEAMLCTYIRKLRISHKANMMNCNRLVTVVLNCRDRLYEWWIALSTG